MFRRVALAWLGFVFITGLLAAQPKPSSDLLLPWFEVDLAGGEATAVFALANALDKPVDVTATVSTNWGIPVLEIPLRLKPREVRTFDLRRWLGDGSEEHVQAALSGQTSPKDGLYYSSPVTPGRATGYVTLRTGAGAALRGASRHGDLIDIASPSGLCNRYVLRPPAGGAEALLWQDAIGQPSPSPDPEEHRLQVSVEDRPRMVLPLERVSLEETGTDGWIEIAPEGRSFLSFRDANGRPLPVLKAACAEARKKPKPPKTPKISIVLLTNGRDAAAAPGPSIPVGSPVLWQYQVTNSGKVTLNDIEVFDDQGVVVTCPRKTLKAGQAMSCTAKGVATACQYTNTGIVSGVPAKGPVVNAADASFYFGDEGAAIQIEVTTNGQEADDPRGPTLAVGAQVEWVYRVTNSGRSRLTDFVVWDDHGISVFCPINSLAPGQSMDCTASGAAVAGQFRNVGTATAKTSCNAVSAQDASHYYGESDTGIQLRVLTNGFDANDPPGPSLQPGAPVTWEYTVTNTGKLFLSQLEVKDDHGISVSCPKNTLGIGESITCIARGVAGVCQYSNLGTVTALTSGGQQVAASDRSHYTGGVEAGLRIESSVNGDDADLPPGPTVPVGLPVSWTYLLVNTGKVDLSGISISDGSLTVACPKLELRPGESIVCTAASTAAAGQFGGTAKASGKAACGSTMTDDDPGFYFGQTGGATDVATVPEDAPATVLNVLANDGGVAPGSFKIVDTIQPQHGTVAIIQNGAALTYKPAPNYCNDASSPDFFTYISSPGGNSLNVEVTVTCADDPPVAVNDLATILMNADGAINLTANDTDVDGGPKSVDPASITVPAHGTATPVGGTTVLYTPDPGYCNSLPGDSLDVFAYALLPGGSTATVTVTVECPGTPPIAVDDQFFVLEDSGITELDVLANDVFSPQITKEITSIVIPPAHGTVTILSDEAKVTYEPFAGYCHDTQPDTFTYMVPEGSTATVEVTVACLP